MILETGRQRPNSAPREKCGLMGDGGHGRHAMRPTMRRPRNTHKGSLRHNDHRSYVEVAEQGQRRISPGDKCSLVKKWSGRAQT
jgi:hypothetical protein